MFGYVSTNGVVGAGVGGSARAEVGGGATVKEEATVDETITRVQLDDWSGDWGMG